MSNEITVRRIATATAAGFAFAVYQGNTVARIARQDGLGQSYTTPAVFNSQSKADAAAARLSR